MSRKQEDSCRLRENNCKDKTDKRLFSKYTRKPYKSTIRKKSNKKKWAKDRHTPIRMTKIQNTDNGKH